jgi:hypothetical protein
LHKVALVSLVAGLVCLSGWGQESGGFGGVQSIGISPSYSPNSSHILIGLAEQRRTWTLGLEYTHLLHLNREFRFDYEGSLLPLYEESDPTVTGTITTIDGNTFRIPQTPVRVIYVDHGPVGTAILGHGATEPIYATFGRENTYAAALIPFGGRVNAFPRSRIQPSFSLDLGFVVSSRDLPVDDSDQFNYLFSFGPGVQVYVTARSSMRVEYVYRHISNAHQGYENPGVDQGVFRVTLSRYR